MGDAAVTDLDRERALTYREENAELIDACQRGHGTLYGQDDLAAVVGGLSNECVARELNERAEMRRSDEYLESYRRAEADLTERGEQIRRLEEIVEIVRALRLHVRSDRLCAALDRLDAPEAAE